MAHQIAQKVAPNGAALLDRVAELRVSLGRPPLLRREAARLLDAVPDECTDVVAWSPEAYSVALVASVLADEDERELTVHYASLLTPLAPRQRHGVWTWVSAEELLGLGPPRVWAVRWAIERGGTSHNSSGVVLALVN